MANWDDVSRIVAELPETAELTDRNGLLSWRVRAKPLAWERPLRRSDLAELGAAAPDGPILAARVPDLGARAALLADPSGVYFITSHFADYPAILVKLPEIAVAELRELLVEAWFGQAPKRLAAAYRDRLEIGPGMSTED
ncbi:MmcQ/YjbR family DNA-binding protein [Plantactinospora sp. KBS50]|uniref:MmcQ/YjbR family DNA-binding protein n=1 Tax=Plantactinospora sp. KBS50 TaxID=2024580 RepID=UPI000BAA9ED8|nr:hypothetical protein [Plantactinospora sp. KBS50]ASW57562.1 hypothetical protein CIK06_09645 [Plantactinospora sp. KBS50]